MKRTLLSVVLVLFAAPAFAQNTSSAVGGRIVDVLDLLAEEHPELAASLRAVATEPETLERRWPGVVTTGRRPPLHLDPPEHTVWRKAMSGPFKSQAIAALEPQVRALTVAVKFGLNFGLFWRAARSGR